MKFYPTASFVQRYKKLPPKIQKKVDKALNLLSKDLRHPSLRCKKYDEEKDIWQGRVDRDYRFYFLIEEDAYILLEVESHPE